MRFFLPLMLTCAVLVAGEETDPPLQSLPEEPMPEEPKKVQPAESKPVLLPERLFVLRTLTEAAEEGSRRKCGKMSFTPVMPEQPADDVNRNLLEANFLYRRLYAARAGWYGGLAAWQESWSNPGPTPVLSEDSVARCTADSLVEVLTEFAQVLIDPTALPDHSPVKEQRPIGVVAPAGVVPTPRGDEVALLPIASSTPPTWNYLSTWQILGPYPLPPVQIIPAVELPICAELPGISYQVGGGPALRWRRVELAGDKVMIGAEAGRFHAITSVESVLSEDRWLRLRSSGNIQLWLNDRVAWSGEGPVAVELKLHLTVGRHRLRIDGSSSGSAWISCEIGSEVAAPLSKAMTTAEADAILAQVPPRWSLDAPHIAPLKDWPAAIPMWGTCWNTMPPRWLVIGPLKAESQLDPKDWKPELGQTVPGTTETWRLLGPDQARFIRGFTIESLYFRVGRHESVRIDLKSLMAAGAGSGLMFMATLIDNDRLRLVNVKANGPGGRAWLNGIQLSSNSKVHLLPGRHLLIFSFTTRSLPPSLMKREIHVMAGLQQADTINSLHRQWLDTTRPLERSLLRIVRTLPGTPQATQALSTLELINESAVNYND